MSNLNPVYSPEYHQQEIQRAARLRQAGATGQYVDEFTTVVEEVPTIEVDGRLCFDADKYLRERGQHQLEAARATLSRLPKCVERSIGMQEQSTEIELRTPKGEIELSVDDVVSQVAKIQQIMEKVMKKGEHYGVIPGCGNKPTLLKPGAEKLGFTFRMMPKFIGAREPIDLGNGHREYVICCELYHVITEKFCGSGVGSCSTMESKYRYRTGPKEWTGKAVPSSYWNLRKTNPRAAQESLGGKGYAVGKNPDNGQWEITRQGEKVENDNPADQYNTVLKMAKKRAHADAILTGTAASDIFTQDLEDLVDHAIDAQAQVGEETTNGAAESSAETVVPDAKPLPSGRPRPTEAETKRLTKIAEMILNEGKNQGYIGEQREELSDDEKRCLTNTIYKLLGHWPKSENEIVRCAQSIKPESIFELRMPQDAVAE